MKGSFFPQIFVNSIAAAYCSFFSITYTHTNHTSESVLVRNERIR